MKKSIYTPFVLATDNNYLSFSMIPGVSDIISRVIRRDWYNCHIDVKSRELIAAVK